MTEEGVGLIVVVALGGEILAAVAVVAGEEIARRAVILGVLAPARLKDAVLPAARGAALVVVDVTASGGVKPVGGRPHGQRGRFHVLCSASLGE
jgi:hypothetical protein